MGVFVDLGLSDSKKLCFEGGLEVLMTRLALRSHIPGLERAHVVFHVLPYLLSQLIVATLLLVSMRKPINLGADRGRERKV